MPTVLENDSARVVIAPEHGGRVAALCVGGHDLLVGQHENPLLWGCYPMAPWAGRLRHGRLAYRGQVDAFPASLGWHPWFRRVLDCGATARVDFAADLVYERDDEAIPTGQLHAPGAGPWDDCFTALRCPPTITWPGALQLVLHATVEHWMFYDEPDQAVCIEPMSGPPNALNAAPHIVAPGAPLCADFRIEWRPG